MSVERVEPLHAASEAQGLATRPLHEDATADRRMDFAIERRANQEQEAEQRRHGRPRHTITRDKKHKAAVTE